MDNLDANKLTLEDVEELKGLLEVGMQEEAEKKVLNLAARIEKDKVYSQVGALTRDLHDALTSFAEDDRLKTIAKVEMPDASERLKYIISMTDNAANTTLDAVEACEPMVQALTSTIKNLLPTWAQLMHGQIDRFEFVSLCHKVDNLIIKTRQNAEEVSGQLTKILMAQDYQDLTGQMLQKVIKLVTEVEEKLVSFLVSFEGDGVEHKQIESEATAGLTPQGPALDKHKQTENVAASQDDVDDLLESLGF